jgi:hypothetical protein
VSGMSSEPSPHFGQGTPTMPQWNIDTWERMGFTPIPTLGYAAYMDTQPGFRPVGEVVADERGRIAFGKAGVRHDDRYAVALNDDGEILLTPLASIPRRELIVWEDKDLRMTLAQALAESETGKTVGLGDFTQFADDEVDED